MRSNTSKLLAGYRKGQRVVRYAAGFIMDTYSHRPRSTNDPVPWVGDLDNQRWSSSYLQLEKAYISTRVVRDEDGEPVGEARHVHYADEGWFWRAWAYRDDPEYDYVWTKLGLHTTPGEAEAEVNRYWGIPQ